MESPLATFSSTVGFWTQYRANRAVVNRLRSTYVAWGLFAGLPLLLMVVMLCLGNDLSTPGAFGLPVWAVVPSGLSFMLVLMPLIQLVNISSMRSRNSTTGDPWTYTITQEGYTIHSSLVNTTLKWEAFIKAIETKGFLLLFMSPRLAHFIPKAAATDSDLQTIRTILREKLGAKAKLRTA